MFQKMKKYSHMIAIIFSAIASALTASGFGGDPLVGAAIGTSLNVAVSAVS